MKFNYRYLLAIIPLVIVGSILYYLSDIVSYVVLGWVISMVGAPMVVLLRKYVGKNMAAGLTLTSFVLILGLLLWIFIPPLMTQARNLAGIDYQAVADGLEEPINDWQKWLESKGIIGASGNLADLPVSENGTDELIQTKVIHLDSLLNENGDTLSRTNNIALVINVDNRKRDLDSEKEDNGSFFDNVRKNVYAFVNPSRITQVFGSVMSFFGNMVIALLSILFISFFFLREQGLFNNMIAAAVASKYENQTVQAINETSKLLIRYFIGILSQMTFITLFVSIALSFLGVKNALLIGFFAALMNVIPYIGPIIGAAFAAIITISSNLELSFYDELVPLLLKVLAVFGVMQLMDNFFLQPNIFSKSVKAHPLEIFIIVLIGAKIGGVIGMVLAIPAYTVIRVVAKVFLSEFKVVQRITQGL